MRILNISAQKPDSTGSGTYLHEMVRSMAAAGHDVAVVAGIGPEDGNGFSGNVLFRPVRFQTSELPFPVVGMSDEMPYPSTRYRDLTPAMVSQFESAFACAVTEVDKTFNPDIVICHHLYLLTAIVRKLLPHRRVAAICHSTDLRQMNSHQLERSRIIEGVASLDAILALHDAQKAEIVELYRVPDGRVHVVGTGYNARIFHARNASRDNEEPHAPTLVYAGKIWRKKGVESLLEAIDALGSRLPDLSVRLAGGHGDPDEYARIRRRAERCTRTVAFLGKLSQQDLANEYRKADVFVLPSFFEGLPLVVIEALACGCRVVTTDLPGIRPWIEKSLPGAPVVYVHPPRMRNVDEPVEEDLPAFEARLADALATAFQESAQSYDTEKLSWDVLVEKVVGILR